MSASAAAAPASAALGVRLTHQASKGNAASTIVAGDAGPPAEATIPASATAPSTNAIASATNARPVAATSSAIEKSRAEDRADAGQHRRSADERRQEDGCRRGDQERGRQHDADQAPLAKTLGRFADGAVDQALAARGDGVKQLTCSGPR